MLPKSPLNVKAEHCEKNYWLLGVSLDVGNPKATQSMHKTKISQSMVARGFFWLSFAQTLAMDRGVTYRVVNQSWAPGIAMSVPTTHVPRLGCKG